MIHQQKKMATLSRNTSLYIVILDKKRCKPLSLSHSDESNYFKTLTDLIVSEGQCHEDTQCCFRSLLCLSHYLAPLHQMFDLWSYEEDTCIKPISSAGSTNHNIFWWHFCSHGIKNWKSWPKFFKFESMSILVIYRNRWQEIISMPQ